MNMPESLGSEKLLLFSGLKSGVMARESSEAANSASPAGKRWRILILASRVIQY
jgi:hypothetical protein